MKPRVIDLFAGVGGLSLGFEKQRFEVLIANECDKSIRKKSMKSMRMADKT